MRGGLDLHATFPHSGYPQGFGQLSAWKQVSPQGRDAHVEVTVPGFLYPLGTPAYLTTMTWREITAGANGEHPSAGLLMKQFLTLGDPETAFTDRHELPFTMARVGPRRTPDLVVQLNNVDPFVPSLPGPGGTQSPLLWKVDAQDHDGETIHLRTPLVWVRANSGALVDIQKAVKKRIKALDAQFRDEAGELLKIDALGQTVAFAPALAGDQQITGDRGARANAETRTLWLTGDLAPTLTGSTPRLSRADVVVPAIKRLSPVAGVVSVSYPAAYREQGFSAGNVGNVFLELKSPTRLDFGTSERAGGFIQPDVIVGGLSRANGLVADAAAAAAGTFDPAALLAGAFPKLFGLFDLSELVKVAAEEVRLNAAPKFVTEQLDRVSALLHDAETLQALAEQLPTQLAGIAAAAKAVPASVAAWLGAITNSALAADAHTALTALQSGVGHIADALPGMVLSPFQRGELERVTAALTAALATLDDAAGLFSELTQFVSGLASGGGEVRTRLDWKPKVNNLPNGSTPVIKFKNPDTALKLSVEARASTAIVAGLDVSAELTDFQLILVPGFELMGLDFTRLAFRGGTSRRPEVDLVFGGISFLGILSFVETLKELIPLDGFSDPPFLDVSAEGVSAGFTVALPNLAIGVFSLSNLALGADARVPFLGESVSVGFNFCTRERPFTLGVFPLGGGGFFGIRLNPTGVVLLEAAFEFGAVVALNFGVASGSVSAMGGVYFRLEGNAGSLTGYFRVRGEVDVLSLISASIELYMALTYAFQTGKVIGEASITVSVEVLFFSTSVSIHARREFAGANGDPTAREMLFDKKKGDVDPSWNAYWAAFAQPVGARAMASQSLVLTVLPVSSAAAAAHHVSLHIAPRIVPDTDRQPLSDFELFIDWAEVATRARFTLRDGSGKDIAAKPLLDAVQPKPWNAAWPADLWARVFPPDTPVSGPRFESFANRDLRSFDARAAHDVTAATTLLSALLFPIDPPDFNPVPKFGRQQFEFLDRFRVDALDKLADFDERLTKALDAGQGGGTPLGGVLTVLNRVRRFYERPEAQRPYLRTPTPGATELNIDKPRPDFHERVAHLADQPAMLRALGLVIDVRVDDLASLRLASGLSAAIAFEGMKPEVIAPVTPVTHLAGGRLVATPRTGDWINGRLALGDPKRFSVLAMDTDGGALKLERYLRSLPRMYAMAANNDPGHVAPPALRSEGLTVVRANRGDTVRKQLAAATGLLGKVAPYIAAEDVTRGFRVDVWDDHEQRWFSPHRRLATARLTGAEPSLVYKDLPEFGSVAAATLSETPGIADSPAYLHEALFGWSGWSLSTPRPGKRVEPVHVPKTAPGPDGQAVARGEKVQREQAAAGPAADDPTLDTVTPVLLSTRVEPGSLPRLRYGRAYAFRAWGVDLAGNSPGDPLVNGPTFTAPVVPAATAAPIAVTSMAAAAAAPTSPVPVRLASHLRELHAVALQVLGEPAPADPAAIIGSARAHGGDFVLTGDAAVDRLATARLRARGDRRISQPAATQLLARSDTVRTALDTLSVDQFVPFDPAKHIAFADGTVSPLTPFRRWDPVPPPVVVARHRFSIAESVNHLVIRSGVAAAADPAGGDRTSVVPPAAYIAGLLADAKSSPFAADFRATSERHLAAPKGSMHLNELHGRLDPLMSTPEVMLPLALRDDGTLFDEDRVDLANRKTGIAQPGVALKRGPEMTGPAVSLKDIAARRGDPPPAGYYVIHDTDQLALPYLPDPLAAGVALGMSEANRGSPLGGAFRAESTAARYHGDWPEPQPFRLVLAGHGDADAPRRGQRRHDHLAARHPARHAAVVLPPAAGSAAVRAMGADAAAVDDARPLDAAGGGRPVLGVDPVRNAEPGARGAAPGAAAGHDAAAFR